MRAHHLGLAVAVVLAGPAAAEDGRRETARDLAGVWQVVPADGRPACAVVLSAAPVGRAFRATPAAECGREIPDMRRVTAWDFEGGLRLLETPTRVVFTFEEDETALPSSPSVAAPRLFLVPRIAGFTRLIQPGEWEGPWRVADRRGRRCTLVFGPPRVADARPREGRVTARGCPDRAVAAVTRWSVDAMSLVLSGSGENMIVLRPRSDRLWASDDGRVRLTR